MLDATEASSCGGPTNPPQTGDVPMPDAVPEAAASAVAHAAPGAPPVPPVPGISAVESEASRAARPVVPPLPVATEAAGANAQEGNSTLCKDCGDPFHLSELTNCQGKRCLGDPKNLLCNVCAFLVESHSCLCQSGCNLWAQDFRGSQTDAPMSDSTDASSWGGPTNPPQTSDVPMPDAVPEAVVSSAMTKVNPWAGMDGVGDATMASAVPSAGATRANRWATEMSDEERSQTGDGKK